MFKEGDMFKNMLKKKWFRYMLVAASFPAAMVLLLAILLLTPYKVVSTFTKSKDESVLNNNESCRPKTAAVAAKNKFFDVAGLRRALEMGDEETLRMRIKEWMAKGGPGYCIAMVESLPHGDLRRALFRLITDEWAREDVVAAGRWAAQWNGEDSKGRTDVLATLVAQVGKDNMAVIPRLLRNWRLNGISRWDLFEAWGRRQAAEGLEAAGDWLMKTQQVFSGAEGQKFRSAALHGMIAQACEKDLEAVKDWVLRVSPTMRSSALGEVARVWGRKDPSATLDWMSKLSEGERATITRELVRGWAENDPVAAMAWATAHSEERNSVALNLVVLREWVAKDPAAARDWAMMLPDEAGRRNALVQVARSWATKDPVAAKDFVMGLSEEEGRGKALSFVVWEWAKVDPAAARDWVSKLPDDLPEAQRHEIKKRMIWGWAEGDPAAAAEWVMSMPEEDRGKSINVVLWSWSSSDPAAASKWAATLPEEAFPDGGMVASAMIKVWRGEEGERLADAEMEKFERTAICIDATAKLAQDNLVAAIDSAFQSQNAVVRTMKIVGVLDGWWRGKKEREAEKPKSP